MTRLSHRSSTRNAQPLRTLLVLNPGALGHRCAFNLFTAHFRLITVALSGMPDLAGTNLRGRSLQVAGKHLLAVPRRVTALRA